MKTTKLLSSRKIDLLICVLLLGFAPLFFYKLGQSSLVSWDEAWYASISHNILQSGNFLHLQFNGKSYLDHPPAGFWFTAMIFKVMGVSDFSARFIQALSGLVSLGAIYFLGRELFSRSVGLASAIALTSSFWFVYRARSGNLDVSLTMFFLLTLFLALKAAKNKAYLIPLAVSLGFLVLSKTLAPLSVIPVILIIFWQAKTLRLRYLIIPAFIFFVLAGGWFIYQFITQPGFLSRYLWIGLPEMKVQTSYLDNVNLAKEYLHNGIGKWFWPGIFSLFVGILFWQRRFLILFVFFIAFLLPALFSPKVHIWHLIPLHPILILAFFGFLYALVEKIMILMKVSVSNRKELILLTSGVMLIISITLTYHQLRRIWYQFIDIPAYISDEAILSQEAGKYNLPFFIDGPDFVPAAAFYSGKKVSKIWEGGMADLFLENSKFILITYQWRLDQAKITSDQYRIIKADRDKILVIRQ